MQSYMYSISHLVSLYSLMFQRRYGLDVKLLCIFQKMKGLDVKTRQCIFIGYVQDQLGYRFYDPIQKKLIRCRDVVFIEYQTIVDIKSEKNASRSDNNSDLSLVPRHVGDEVQNDQPRIDDADTPIENESDGEDDNQSQPPVQEVSPIPLRKSTRIKYPSVRLSED